VLKIKAKFRTFDPPPVNLSEGWANYPSEFFRSLIYDQISGITVCTVARHPQKSETPKPIDIKLDTSD